MAEIDKMIKYSAGEIGVYEKAKNKVKNLSSKVFGEQNREREALSEIVIMEAGENFPTDIKNVISKIRNASIWNKDTLEKIDPKMAKHINGLSKSINALIEKMSNLKGENNVLNAEYSDIQTAFVEYLGIVEECSTRVGDMVEIQKSSIVKQKENLDISSSRHATQSLISAFAYMGREVKVNPDGSYECGEKIDGRGFRYRDADGNNKYIAISKEATQSFIDNYLKTGGVNTEKEERDLAEAKDALRQMKENKGEVGIYAVTSSDISAQEKVVEKAQRALNEKMAQVVTPKGLFTYFVEQELIGDTSKRSTDKFSLLRARNEFSTESKVWENFEVTQNPQLFLDDLSLMATNVLSSFKMQDISEKNVPAYGDDVKSDFASGIINSNRLDRIESDLLKVKAVSSDLMTQSQQSFQGILGKYEEIASAMEESSKLDKDNQQLAVMATEARARVETLVAFSELVTDLSDQIESGEIPAPESVKNNIAGFISEIVSNSTLEDGKLSLNNNLTNEAGDIWLSKEDFDNIMSNQMEETTEETKEEAHEEKQRAEMDENSNEQERIKEMNDEEAMSFRSSVYGLEFDKGMTFGDAIDTYSQEEMIKFLIGDQNNVVATLFDGYKNTNLDAKTYVKQVMGADFEQDAMLLGVLSMDTICDTFDQVAGRGDYSKTTEQNNKAGENSQSNTTQGVNNTKNGTKADVARNRARLAFYYMDEVINAIKADEKLYAEYLEADGETKDKIFSEKYEQIKSNIQNPSEEKLEKAEKKYLKTYQADKILAIANELGDKKIPEGAVSLLNKLAEKYGVLENIKEQNGNSATGEGENPKAKTDKKKFGELYPRSPSAKAIAKKLQPFNIAAGIKFFNQLLDAFQKIDVKMGGDEEDTKADTTSTTSGGNKNQKNESQNQKDDSKNADNLNAQKTPEQGNQNDGVGLDESLKTSEDTATSENTATMDSNGQPSEIASEQVVVEPNVAPTTDQASKLFEGRSDDQIRSRLAVMSVGMSINSVLDTLNIPEDVSVDRIRQAMDYMTMQELPQPVVNIKINGRTSAVILSDAMQYVFLNEFACGNKDAKEASKSIDEIASQLGDNEAIVSVVKSMSPLMGAITPGEIVHLVKQTAEVENPQPGEPLSIDLGSKLTPEDIAVFRNLKSMAQVRELLRQSEMYNPKVIEDIFEAGNELRDGSKLKDPQNGELTID